MKRAVSNFDTALFICSFKRVAVLRSFVEYARDDRPTVSQRVSFTCSFVGLCRIRLSQGIETEGAGSLLL